MDGDAWERAMRLMMVALVATGAIAGAAAMVGLLALVRWLR